MTFGNYVTPLDARFRIELDGDVLELAMDDSVTVRTANSDRRETD